MPAFSDVRAPEDFLLVFGKSRVHFRLSSGDELELCFLGSFRAGAGFNAEVLTRDMVTAETFWDFIEISGLFLPHQPGSIIYIVERDTPDDLSFWRGVSDTPYGRSWLASRPDLQVVAMKIDLDREIPLDMLVRRLKDYSGVLEDLYDIQKVVSALAGEIPPIRRIEDSGIVVAGEKRKSGKDLVSESGYLILPGEYCLVDQQGIMEYHGSRYELPRGFCGMKLLVKYIGDRIYVYRDDDLVATFPVSHSDSSAGYLVCTGD